MLVTAFLNDNNCKQKVYYIGEIRIYMQFSQENGLYCKKTMFIRIYLVHAFLSIFFFNFPILIMLELNEVDYDLSLFTLYLSQIHVTNLSCDRTRGLLLG